MTHAEALAGNRSGLEPSTCPGPLERIAAHPDRDLIAGRVVERTVEVYRCADCGARVSMSGDRVLNAYLPPPGVLVAELAEALTLRR